MRVILAGYNLDTEVIKELKKREPDAALTPETISAAYARISRSQKSVEELRREAREEITKARKSNRRIIFEMSHHSIAEHAVFNFDIIGISRYAVEEFEKFRLCDYTEKSQRYVTLKGDFVIPKELKNSKLVDNYLKMITRQNAYYLQLFEKLKAFNFKKFAPLAKDERNHRTLENLAKEDARYILSLATQTQLGATVNARNLELMIRRFASHGLSEINRLGERLYHQVKRVTPSLILFYRANDYDRWTYPALKEFCKNIGEKGYRDIDTAASKENGEREKRRIKDVILVDYTPAGDDKILAALLHRVKDWDYLRCLRLVSKMSEKEKIDLFKKSSQYMELYDTALREFEYANLTYALIVSAACFGQLKRHRIATITAQNYNPNLGWTIPVSIQEIGEAKNFIEIIKATEDIYYQIEKRFPGVGAYILTNAHNKRVLLKVNLRELYHISRLREDPTAQWDIHNKVTQLSNLAKAAFPITTRLLGSKTRYPEIYRSLFGKYPKIKEVPGIS